MASYEYKKGNKMEINSDTIGTIRNSACIICNKGFTSPRAGKYYCSSKCKQFAFYHKGEIQSLGRANKGISDICITLSLNEYYLYDKIVARVLENANLERRMNSSYYTHQWQDAKRKEEIEKSLPEYLKSLKVYKLNLEEWSFLKILHPNKNREEFLKLLNSLDRAFFANLVYPDPSIKKRIINNPIQNLFFNHLSKIADGKIIFK